MTRVLLITGAARGIGAATARLAGARGYLVAVNYRQDSASADRVVQDITRAGGRAVAIQADVAVEADVVRMFEACDRDLGRVTALVNNAGVLDLQSRVDAMTAARVTRTLAINVVGSMVCAREAIRRMSRRHGGAGGAIVNVSSGASRWGSPGEYVDYAASKGAVDSMTLGLAREVAEEGIRVNAVRPGFTYTDIHALGGEPNRVDRVKTQVPMQRGAQAEEIAHAILWLLSDEASYTTGAILDVAGGK